VARRGGARPSGTSHGAALLGAEADGGGKRSQLSGQALLFLAPSQLPVGRPWRPDARNGGGRLIVSVMKELFPILQRSLWKNI